MGICCRRWSALVLVSGATVLGGLAGCTDDVGTDEASLDPAVTAAEMERAFLEKDDQKADTAGCSGVRVPDQGDFGLRVALTFDDGPNLQTTPQILEILRRHGVPATFFTNGVRLQGEEARALAREIAEDPDFILGNHTWSHANLPNVSASRAAQEVERLATLVEELGERARFFRFPFGSASCATHRQVSDRGYHVTGWHIDSADWCFSTHDGRCPASAFRYVDDDQRDDMLGFTLDQVHARRGGVVLFHDIHAYTAGRLEAFIERLEDDGYTFTSLDDVATFPRLNGLTPPAPKFIGDPCTTAAECAYTDASGALPGYCHPAGFCSLSCAGYCPDRAGKTGTFCTQDPTLTDPTGLCVVQATDANGQCAALPGTLHASAERYLGTSTAAPKTAEVCLPAPPAGQ